jgi:holo-[acyl-carrier protein] synthase
MTIVGVGVDIVDVARFAASIDRTPGLADRLLTEAERATSVERQAARFAVKEAVAKALGSPGNLEWHDAEVVTDDNGRPRLATRGTVAAAAATAGVQSWHVSISHDAGFAIGMVVAER